jgi:hypothetical protein
MGRDRKTKIERERLRRRGGGKRRREETVGGEKKQFIGIFVLTCSIRITV